MKCLCWNWLVNKQLVNSPTQKLYNSWHTSHIGYVLCNHKHTPFCRWYPRQTDNVSPHALSHFVFNIIIMIFWCGNIFCPEAILACVFIIIDILYNIILFLTHQRQITNITHDNAESNPFIFLYKSKIGNSYLTEMHSLIILWKRVIIYS